MHGDTPERFLRLFRNFDQDKYSFQFEDNKLIAKPKDGMELRSGSLVARPYPISIDMAPTRSIEGEVIGLGHGDIIAIADAANTEYTHGNITYNFPMKKSRISTLPVELWLNTRGFSIMGYPSCLLYSGSSKDVDRHLELMARDVDELRFDSAPTESKEKIAEVLRGIDFVERVDEKAKLRKPVFFEDIEKIAISISENLSEETSVMIETRDMRKEMLQKMSPTYDSNLYEIDLKIFYGGEEISGGMAYEVFKTLGYSKTHIKMHQPFERTVNPMMKRFGDDMRIS